MDVAARGQWQAKSTAGLGFNTPKTRALKVNNIIPLVNNIVFQDKLLCFSFKHGDCGKKSIYYLFITKKTFSKRIIR